MLWDIFQAEQMTPRHSGRSSTGEQNPSVVASRENTATIPSPAPTASKATPAQVSLIHNGQSAQVTTSSDPSPPPVQSTISDTTSKAAYATSADAMKVALLSQKRDMSDPKQRADLVKQLKAIEDDEIRAAHERARQMGIPIHGPNFTLVGFDGDVPRYQAPENVNAAISTSANQVRSTAPFNVDGTGWKMGLWEAGGIPRVTHQEFDLPTRITVIDGSTTATDHASHVAGTLMGQGIDARAKGMAPGLFIDAYSATSDLSEMTSAGAAYGGEPGKIYVSNHSYGYLRGWDGGSLWYGTYTDNNDPSDDVDVFFGAYTALSASYDAMLFNLPFYLPIASAGNQRDDAAPSNGALWTALITGDDYIYDATKHPLGDGVYKLGYDTIEYSKTCKNILTVGAVNDAVNGVTRTPALGTISNFSSTGPTDDGRIKPDVVGNGVSLFSAVSTSNSAYSNFSGTSMSGPNVAGSAMLLVDYYNDRFPGQFMKASTLKALIIHTADDIGNPGPDYFYGWGLMDTKEAADQIKRHADKESYRGIQESALSTATPSRIHTFTWNGTDPIRVTLSWTDPAGPTSTTNDNRVRDLVNDLNLTVTGPTGTTHRPFIMPYVGNWTNAMLSANATTGINTVDNVEQVLISAPPSTGLYTVTVNHAGLLTNGSQDYSLIITGQTTDDLEITPLENLAVSGYQGGPLAPQGKDYTLTNSAATGSLNWTVTSNVPWVTPSSASGSLAARASATVTLSITAAADNLPVGLHTATITFTNTISGFVTTRLVTVDAKAHVFPSIQSSPQPVTVNEGSSATFSVTATGGGLNYQWQKDTTNIPTATSPSYTIASTTAANAGSYRCVVTNSVGSVTSSAALLTVITPPVITQQPVSQIVEAGQNVTFSVTATGLFLTYQWQKNGTNIPSGTGTSITLSNVTTTNIGDYRCIVSNPAGQTPSSIATLFVNGSPTIIQHPVDTTAATGGSAQFEVRALGPDLLYQWQFGGEPIPSATSSILTVNPVSTGSVGSYRCIVSNIHGIVTSQPALLEIVTAPVLIFPTAPSTLNLKLNLTANFSTTVAGRSLSYEWQKDGSPLGTPSSPAFGISPLQASHSGIYRCRVFNAAGEIFSAPVTLNVLLPPVITAHPVPQTVELGAAASMSITATGASLYQWLLNGSPIGGANAPTYNIPIISTIHLGDYSCEVTNAGGSVRSQRALLAIEGMPIITRPPFPVLAEIGAPVRMDLEAVGDSLTYAWKRGATLLSTQMIFEAGNMTKSLAGAYIGQVANSIQTVSSAPVPISLVSDISPALDAATIKWSTTGHTFWRPVTAATQTKDGKDAMVSSPMQNNQKCILSTRLTGPFLLKWWQKTSSEADKDKLTTYLDGVEISSASGETDWTETQLSIPIGVHLLEFVFAKDSAISGGQDRAWLDGFTIAPDYEPTGTASDRLVPAGSEVVINAPYTGTPQTFQWRFNGKSIRGATAQQLVLRNITTSQAGQYDCLLGAIGNGVKMSRTSPPTQIGIVNAVDKIYKVKGGGKVAFTTFARGKNLNYKWWRGSRELIGETTPSIERSSLQSFDAGDYYCEISNPGGMVVAGINTLHVYDTVPEIILTANMPPAIVSGNYSYFVPYNDASNRVPTLWKSTKLPAGLKLNSATGEIYGIPTTPTTTPYQITITALNGIDKIGHTINTTITIHDLGRKIGSFIAILTPHPSLNQNFGGRLNITIASTGSFSGNLTLGESKHSFTGRLTASLDHQDLAFATVTIKRKKLPSLSLEFTVDDTELLTSASVTDSASSLPFSGWRNSWNTTSRPDIFVGTAAPLGVYTFGMDIASEFIGSSTKPQGTGYGTVTINPTSGIATTTGKLADNTTYITSGFASKTGEIPIFTMPYKGSVKGSLVGDPAIIKTDDVHDNTLDGEVHWWRRASTSKSERFFKTGFSEPLALTLSGARYIAPISPNLILGLIEGSLHPLDLIFQQGGIGTPAPGPDINVTLGTGNVINLPEPAANERSTTLTVDAAKGSFSGSFTLKDTDPLDLRPPPAILRVISRKVTYQGLLIRDSLGWKGAGYFLLPELPDVTGETISNTPIHSGQVLLLPPEPAPEE